MPEISRFFGIVIGMFFHEHGVPHFPAVYGDHRISVEVETSVVRGEFPVRAQELVLEWAAFHRGQLLENWQAAREGRPLTRVAPLE